MDVNTEGWQRQEERQSFDKVVPVAQDPHLPDEQGYLVRSYSPIEESAHQVGRVLHEIADPNMTNEIATELSTELAAVEKAECGDLSGRARQAVELTRADASPVQVAAADALLRDAPQGTERLFTEVDATAAAVAATHWLWAAAQVAAEVSGLEPTNVVFEADNIEALAHRTPTLVLELLDDGLPARTVVAQLIAEAMTVAEGGVPDLTRFVEQLAEAMQLGQQCGDKAAEITEALLPDRISVLDPARPAQDLLEDLLDGIRGCRLIYSEYAEDESDEDDDFSDDDLSDEDDDKIRRRLERTDAEFDDAVRARAEAEPERPR